MYDIGGEGLWPHASGVQTGQGRENANGPYQREWATAHHGTAPVVSTGPKGERHSTNLIGCVMNVAEVAISKVEYTRYVQPYKVRAGRSGARACASSATQDERKSVWRATAAAR